MAERKEARGNTEQHSFRMDPRLWDTYVAHRSAMGSSASAGLRLHALAELEAAGKLAPEDPEPDEESA